jgi:hypothetical protein
MKRKSFIYMESGVGVEGGGGGALLDIKEKFSHIWSFFLQRKF